MKTTMMMLTMLVMLSGCSVVDTKPDNSYERQNAAAAKAYKDLDREQGFCASPIDLYLLTYKAEVAHEQAEDYHGDAQNTGNFQHIFIV